MRRSQTHTATAVHRGADQPAPPELADCAELCAILGDTMVAAT
jgi:hypothetical protein